MSLSAPGCCPVSNTIDTNGGFEDRIPTFELIDMTVFYIVPGWSQRSTISCSHIYSAVAEVIHIAAQDFMLRTIHNVYC